MNPRLNLDLDLMYKDLARIGPALHRREKAHNETNATNDWI